MLDPTRPIDLPIVEIDRAVVGRKWVSQRGRARRDGCGVAGRGEWLEVERVRGVVRGLE